MSLKLKALGLGSLATMAMAAFAAMNASATEPGHFTSNSANEKTVITGIATEGTEHTSQLAVPGLAGMACKHVVYDGTAEPNTVESVLVTPTYEECRTVGSETNIPIHTNECGFRFTIGTKAEAHNEVHIECKGSKKYIEITHPSCTIRIPEQTLTGISYTTDVVNGKHAITLDATIEEEITMHFEGGFCVLLGTSHVASFEGSATVTGFEDEGVSEEFPYGKEGAQVDITATGSED